jgi:hypothetical protein
MMVSDEKALFRCMSKATISPKVDEEIESKSVTSTTTTTTTYGTHWLLARRGILKVYSDRLVFGKFVINNSDIEKAVLYSMPRQFLVFPCFLLVIETKLSVFQFGLNGWNSFWKQELPFPAERQKGTIGYSYYSIAVRIVVIIWCIYVIVKYLLNLH